MASRPVGGDPRPQAEPSDDERVEEILSTESESTTEEPTPSRSSAQPPRPEARKRTSPSSPAYVAPIPKIGAIPRVATPAGIGAAPSSRPQLPEFVGKLLVGMRVDEYGDIVDGETGRVVARVGGDLPSMVGRTVSNVKGDILGDDGELLGYVDDVIVDKAAAGGSPGGAKSLMDLMRQKSAPSLMVDPLGNILDASGNVVGKFHDNNNPMHRREREEKRRESGVADALAEDTAAPKEEESAKPSPSATPQQPESSSEQPGQEKKENAQSWRKENESPSDIFLDVKSTTEGIQLTIRIPTVFGQVRPNVQFS